MAGFCSHEKREPLAPLFDFVLFLKRQFVGELIKLAMDLLLHFERFGDVEVLDGVVR